jgi:hypothetical protein
LTAGRELRNTGGVETTPPPRKKRILLRVVAVLVMLAVIGPGLYTYGSLHYAYSDGERVGFVQKLSRRGWLCKTNEGELAMANIPGQMAEIFRFTVPDPKLAAQIESLAGHKVALQYEQHRGVPLSCFGDTEYFVVGVRKAE